METKPEAPIAKSEMSSTEAAEFLHVTRRSVARFATEGKLASQKKGNKLFFKRSDVEDFALKRGIIQPLETEPHTYSCSVNLDSQRRSRHFKRGNQRQATASGGERKIPVRPSVRRTTLTD